MAPVADPASQSDLGEGPQILGQSFVDALKVHGDRGLDAPMRNGRPRSRHVPLTGAFALIGTLAGIRLLGLRRQRTAVSAVNDGNAHAVPELEPA